MVHYLKTQLHKIIASLSVVILLFTATMPTATATDILIYSDEIAEQDANTLILDFNNTTGDVVLQFGETLGEQLFWDESAANFVFTDDVDFSSNQIVNARVENVSVLPGGAPGLGAAGEGRVVILDSTDSTAPGCTVVPNCAAGTYIWDGSAWISLVGAPTSNNLTKVVTVGSVSADYTTIAAAAAYLQTRSGGIMLLSAETHTVTAAIDLTNVTMVGKGASRTTVQISGAGQLDSFDTAFRFLKFDVNSITDDMAIDMDTGASSLRFEFVDFEVQDSGDSLVDSNNGTPTVSMNLIKCNDGGGSGTILKAQSSSSINNSSVIFIDSRRGNNPLDLADWDITLSGGGNVDTSGTIFPVPANSIIVSPEMNLQGAINSLATGGQITLLPGTHNISTPIIITSDSLEIRGFGDATKITTSGSFAGITDATAAIQIGAADGSAPADGVVIRDLRVEVNDSIHGVRTTGGADNRIENVTIIKTGGTSGSGATAKIGILFIDGSLQDLVRPVIRGNRVLGSGGTNRFTDGIHVSSNGTFAGVFGFGNNVSNALVEGNNVDYVGETGYVFYGATDSSLFNNRASRMSTSGGAYGIYIGSVDNLNMTANVFANSGNNTTIAVGVDSFGTTSTTDSIFNANIIDGDAGGGVGFQTGFSVGGTSNIVARNSFQNNNIIGSSNPAGTTNAFILAGNADDNTITNNEIGSTALEPWDNGISLNSSTQERNLVVNNRFINVTNRIADSATGTRLGVTHHRATVDPTTNDDLNDGYEVGTTWINTSTDDVFLLTDSAVGAAVWRQLNGGGGGFTNNVFYAYDDTGGQAVTGTEVTVNLDNNPISDSSYSLAGDVVTINTSGVYEITAEVTLEITNNSGGPRSDFEITLREQNLGFGVFSDIPGAISGCYTREGTDRFTCSLTILHTFQATDELDLRVRRNAGSTNIRTLANASRLIIKQIR